MSNNTETTVNHALAWHRIKLGMPIPNSSVVRAGVSRATGHRTFNWGATDPLPRLHKLSLVWRGDHLANTSYDATTLGVQASSTNPDPPPQNPKGEHFESTKMVREPKTKQLTTTGIFALPSRSLHHSSHRHQPRVNQLTKLHQRPVSWCSKGGTSVTKTSHLCTKKGMAWM